jgi:drug/metabolite transporter (DMT)-like permease
MSTKLKVHLSLLAVNLIYGANYAIAKMAMPEFISPFAFILIRVGMGSLFYFLLYAMFVREKINVKDIPLFLICGLFGVAINQICFFKGLSLTNEINASLLMITTPILVVIFSAFIAREKISTLNVTGIGLGVLGALLILKGKGSFFTFSSSTMLGDTYIFINAISYSLYLVIVKKLMKRYHPITVICFVFMAGFIPVFFTGWHELSQVKWQHFTPMVWYSIAFVVVFTTFFAYLLNVFALKKTSPSLVGIYIYSQPIFATMISIIMKKEALQELTIVAALLIFGGVYLANKANTKVEEENILEEVK